MFFFLPEIRRGTAKKDRVFALFQNRFGYKVFRVVFLHGCEHRVLTWSMFDLKFLRLFVLYNLGQILSLSVNGEFYRMNSSDAASRILLRPSSWLVFLIWQKFDQVQLKIRILGERCYLAGFIGPKMFLPLKCHGSRKLEGTVVPKQNVFLMQLSVDPEEFKSFR